MNRLPNVTDESRRDKGLSVSKASRDSKSPTTDTPDERERRSRARDRALLSSMGTGAVIRVLTALITMGYFAVSVRALTQVQFGAMATIATFIGLMAFADFGVGGGLMTKLAVAYGRDDRIEARALISGAWSAMLGLGALVSCLGAVSAWVLPWSRILGMPDASQGEARSALLCFVICAGLAVPANIGQRVLMASQRGATVNVWLLASATATLGAISLTALAGAPLWCFVAALVGTPITFTAVQSVWVLCVTYPDLRPQRKLITRVSLWSLGQVSGLFFVLNVAISFAYQCDMLIVSSTLGAASAAVFAIGLRMFGALSGILSGASQQLWTSMAEALSRGDIEWVRTRFLRVLAGTTAIAVAGCVALVGMGQAIARAWVGADLVPSLGLLVAFAVWTVYSLAMAQVGFLMNAAQIIGPQIVMALGMTVANVGLSIYLTHRIGLIGPLVGSICTHVIFSGIPCLFYTRRILRGNERRSGCAQ